MQKSNVATVHASVIRASSFLRASTFDIRHSDHAP
jgi:hypothetical protein